MAPMASATLSMEFWKNDPPETVELLSFLPNGICLTLYMRPTSTVKEIKMEILRISKQYPLHNQIKDAVDYELNGITPFADIETYDDESKRICDLKPIFNLLTLTERTTEKAPVRSHDYVISSLVSSMIKKSHQEYSAPCNPEIEDFRLKIKEVCEKLEEERAAYLWSDKLLYEHPLRLAHNGTMPETIAARLRGEFFLIVVYLEDDTSFTMPMNVYFTPNQLIQMVLDKMYRQNIKVNDPASSFILKVRGREEFLYGDYPIIQYIFIQESLSGSEVPNVVMKNTKKLPYNLNSKNERSSEHQPKRDNDLRNKISMLSPPRYVPSWKIEKPFQVRLHSVENVNYDPIRAMKVGIKMALYHGDHKLCSFKWIDADNNNVNTKCEKFNFEKDIVFDIPIESLPRMSRLCIVFYEVTKASRSKKSSNTKDNLYKENNLCGNINPLAWVNTTVFNYKSWLRNDRQKLRAWTYADDLQSDDIFHPLGTIESNPCKDKCATIVELTFQDYGIDNIEYPPESLVLQYAEELRNREICKPETSTEERSLKTVTDVLAQYMSRDKLYEISERDRSEIWLRRNEFLEEMPEEVSVLLRCVNWNNRNEVATMRSLLQRWPTITVERSLELLDYAYPDPAVRSFAIRCLRSLHEKNIFRDEDILLYLLQLVQAIKHESYLDCDLVNFILERALRNQRIGHYFFWHLRSEMQTPSVQTRFSLLLEAYLKGSKSHVDILRKQLDLLDKLTECSEKAKKGSKEKARTGLQQFFTKVKVVLNGLHCPLDPSYHCKSVKSDKCKVMDSKMRPLWIVFENDDRNCNDIYVIFKNGDDLRQDMLTLQMLRVMDQLWKHEGMDLRMNIYNCISMERRLGMIEVVLNAETIANIQKEKGMFSATSPFKKGALFSWLKEHNKSETDINKAVTEFTLSCAGYCVATYVLGVADRHSDNIMVKRNGQLFHIDFGHILGHFKEKFGVRRERVPFVLTHDFVYVINKGRSDRESEEFLYFQKTCEKAFSVLRKHGCLILSLFSMMISTGLPELSSEKDLNYLKETLVLGYTEEEALKHFRTKFSEALSNSWKTSLNWASHNFSKNNKQ